MLVDLDNVDPTGRVDVAAYRLLGVYAKRLEQQHGLQGTWDAVKPHVGQLISKYLGGVELPSEAELALKLLMLGNQQQQQQKENM